MTTIRHRRHDWSALSKPSPLSRRRKHHNSIFIRKLLQQPNAFRSIWHKRCTQRRTHHCSTNRTDDAWVNSNYVSIIRMKVDPTMFHFSSIQNLLGSETNNTSNTKSALQNLPITSITNIGQYLVGNPLDCYGSNTLKKYWLIRNRSLGTLSRRLHRFSPLTLL